MVLTLASCPWRLSAVLFLSWGVVRGYFCRSGRSRAGLHWGVKREGGLQRPTEAIGARAVRARRGERGLKRKSPGRRGLGSVGLVGWVGLDWTREEGRDTYHKPFTSHCSLARVLSFSISHVSIPAHKLPEKERNWGKRQHRSKMFVAKTARLGPTFCNQTSAPPPNKIMWISFLRSFWRNEVNNLGGFKKALVQNPQDMIRGPIFSEMIRISAHKSELQAKSRSYRPKVRVTAGETPRIRTEPPRKGAWMGLRCFYRKRPWKPSWIHLTDSLLSWAAKIAVHNVYVDKGMCFCPWRKKTTGEYVHTKPGCDYDATRWPQLGPFFVPVCPRLTAINGH